MATHEIWATATPAKPAAAANVVNFIFSDLAWSLGVKCNVWIQSSSSSVYIACNEIQMARVGFYIQGEERKEYSETVYIRKRCNPAGRRSATGCAGPPRSQFPKDGCMPHAAVSAQSSLWTSPCLAPMHGMHGVSAYRMAGQRFYRQFAVIIFCSSCSPTRTRVMKRSLYVGKRAMTTSYLYSITVWKSSARGGIRRLALYRVVIWPMIQLRRMEVQGDLHQA